MGKLGTVFDIQRFSIHDGPGIRTLVFLKGCGLRCAWCANPESQQPFPELFWHAERCTGCGRCIPACRYGAIKDAAGGGISFDRVRCRNCGDCAAVCAYKARVMKGTLMTAGEVADEIEKDADFYQGSSGGATLGGGDPIFNPAFAAEILRECKRRGIHTAVETAGYASWSAFEELIADTDLFLFDVKHMDPVIHKRYTGADNGKILDNLERLNNAGKRIIVRTPVIPGFNDREDNISGIADRLKEMGITEYHLLPYHRYGAEKYRYLGREYPFLCQDEQPKDGVMDRLKAVAGQRIDTVFIG